MLNRIVVLLFFVQVSFGQTKDGIELCLAAQKFANSFISDSEAENALDKILSVIGASKNFTLQPCDDINNALAVTFNGNRYILYDKKFMQIITQYTNNWSNMFILAHEVGHHINGHTRDAALGAVLSDSSLKEQRQEELEADKFAGFVLAKLGASLGQTIAAIDLISSNSDDRYSTHPNKNKRIEAISEGFNNALPSVNSTISKTTNSASVGVWQKSVNDSSNPFEKVLSKAYTFGELKPSNLNNPSKPKLVIVRTVDNKKNEFNSNEFRGRIIIDEGYLRLENLNLNFKPSYNTHWRERLRTRGRTDTNVRRSYTSWSSYSIGRYSPESDKLGNKHINASKNIRNVKDYQLKDVKWYAVIQIIFDNGSEFELINSRKENGKEWFPITGSYEAEGKYDKFNYDYIPDKSIELLNWEGSINKNLIVMNALNLYEDSTVIPFEGSYSSFTYKWRELITNLKSANKMFLKFKSLIGLELIKSPHLTPHTGHRLGDVYDENTYIEYFWELKNSDPSSYYEFDLKGSSKALDFID